MRISSNYSPLFNPSAIRQNQDQSVVSSAESQKSFDEITIHSASPELLDATFVSSLKSSLMEEIQKPVPEAKLDQLTQKIESGTYQVDVNALAEKILAYKGVTSDE